MNARDTGLYHKYHVTRTDGRDAQGEKHHGCYCFVVDVTHDPHAIPALSAYAKSCAEDYPALANDLIAKIAGVVTQDNEFITVPELKLPCGITVSSFRAGKYLSSQGAGDIVQINAQATPWSGINFHDAMRAAARSGYGLETELQALAIAWDASQQDINWTGGKVGEGKLYQGLHKGTVSSGQPATYESPDGEERRWLQLSNGERIWDVAGNLYRWIFDNVQGDEHGLIAEAFAQTSPSIITAPYGPQEKGMGWIPKPGPDWSGYALVRGGYWVSESRAGAFGLRSVWPDYELDYIGFRCTTPIGL